MEDSAGSDDGRARAHPPERGGGAPGAAALQRAGSLLGRAASAAGRLAVVSLISGIVIWWALIRAAGEGRGALLAVAAVALLAPPAVLLLFVIAVRTLLSIPRRIGEVPSALRERGDHIRRRADAVGEARRRGGIPWLVSLGRLWWSIASSRDVLQAVSPAAVLLTPWMLVAAVVAAATAMLEILAGVIAVIWLAA